MMGQNSFSNTQDNSNGANFSGSGQFAGYPASGPAVNSPNPQNTSVADAPLEKTSGKKANFGPIIIALVSALVGAGIAVGIMLLVNNKPTTSEEEETNISVEPASADNDGTQTVEEGVKKYEDDIANSSNDEEKFSRTINEVTYYIINEDYDSALSILGAIDISSLDSYDQYRVYNSYASVYESRGDTAQAERYQQLSDEALSKELQDAEAEQIDEQEAEGNSSEE